jgi:hypothetical protein
VLVVAETSSDTLTKEAKGSIPRERKRGEGRERYRKEEREEPWPFSVLSL